MSVLDRFSPATRGWFRATFEAPTAAQERGWEAISRGEHTLVLAPTGSGKTLAAFLWALDRLLVEGPPDDEQARCRVLYLSPLKALAYDVERNLRMPLAGIGDRVASLRVGTRTGDTPAAERRRFARHPPDILATTPESLYLLLTSAAREALTSVEVVIVDEIHAVAGTKRGAHLALSLERLDRLVGSRHGREVQRIGLSATQRPLEEVARFLGGRGRNVTVVDAGVQKELDLEVVVPPDDPSATGDSSTFPSVLPVLLDLIRTHTSTLIFVNARGMAERLANRLNELAGEDLVRAHHGSISHEQRLGIEDALKAGRLPALVATSSLELGIDMGAIDLVVQVQAPTSVATGLQRIGRAGHRVGEPSKGKIFPRFRGDLLVAAVAASRMQRGLIEETRVPRNPLDILAQQLVAMVVSEDDDVDVDELYEVVTRAYPFGELTREAFEGVLDMLAGRFPSTEFAELRPRLVWDRVAGTVAPRAGARMLAVVSGGTIPERGLYSMFTVDGVRVGELDEEMVHETRVGQVVVLGATSWRVADITRDRVIVVPAPGEPGTMPFWRGDAVGRPYELGRAIGAFLRELDDVTDDQLAEECGLDRRAIADLRAYVTEEREATGGVVPTDERIVVQRFRDELGDWRICVLSPFGSQVHAPWALAVEQVLRRRHGVETQAIWGDDGIVFRFPDADEPPPLDTITMPAAEVNDLVVEAVGSSALFAGRFRENAARSLLLPRRRPGQRTPLWQLRQRAADLQKVASRYPDFPVLLETYRECLRDVFDLPALVALLRDVEARRVRVVAVDTQSPSPFAGSLVWSYVHNFVLDSDAPVAERRAQALTLDRRMLAELLGADELRELIDPAALAQLEAELQALDEGRRARSADAAHDVLRRVGDLTRAELAERSDDAGYAITLVAAGRAVVVKVAGEERLIAVEDAARYRDAVDVALPDGIPVALLAPLPDALEQLVVRWARSHGPFVTREVADRFGRSVDEVDGLLRRLAGEGRVLRGEFRPEGREREWCDPDVLRMLRQRSLAALRREVEPVDPATLARFLPVWHGIGVKSGGLDRLHEVVGQLQGLPLPASVLERDVLAPRVADYRASLLDELAAAGEVVWVGAGRSGRDDGLVALFLRNSPLHSSSVLVPPGDPPPGEDHERIRAILGAQGAAFFPELRGEDEAATLAALWDLVWSGEVTNDSFAPLRARAVGATKRASTGGRSRRTRPRLGTLSVMGPPSAQGRWSLVRREGADATKAAHALAAVLLERHGVLTREAVRGEGVPGGFAAVYPVLRAMEESGRARRGYFVAGLGGAQFALAGAVDRIRAVREDGGRTVLLAATDPANPFGVALPWPEPAGGRAQRVAGAYVVLVDGVASLYVERRGRGLRSLRDHDGTWEPEAVREVIGLLDAGRLSRLVVQRAHPALEPHLHQAGFLPTPAGLTRYPKPV